MSSYGKRGGNRWGPDDWKDFYWLCRILFWVAAVIAAISIWYLVKHQPVCLSTGTLYVIEKVHGQDTLVRKVACAKWKE